MVNWNINWSILKKQRCRPITVKLSFGSHCVQNFGPGNEEMQGRSSLYWHSRDILSCFNWWISIRDNCQILYYIQCRTVNLYFT